MELHAKRPSTVIAVAFLSLPYFFFEHSALFSLLSLKRNPLFNFSFRLVYSLKCISLVEPLFYFNIAHLDVRRISCVLSNHVRIIFTYMIKDDLLKEIFLGCFRLLIINFAYRFLFDRADFLIAAYGKTKPRFYWGINKKSLGK